MELILFIAAVLLTGSLMYCILCAIYFAATRRPVMLALRLSWQLTIASIVGVVFIGVGGILMVTLIVNGALSKLPNYSRTRDISVAVIMAVAGTVGLYFDILYLAFAILG